MLKTIRILIVDLRGVIMSKEAIIWAIAFIITIIVLIKFVPKNKFREAQVIFFFKQLITWIFGLTVAELKLIEYPYRQFPHATEASFGFEFFVYPAVCVIFNLHYPNGKSKARQFMHYFNFCSIITFIEVLCERYTDIIKYNHWTWYATWITLFITFFMSRQYYIWFYKLKDKHNGAE